MIIICGACPGPDEPLMSNGDHRISSAHKMRLAESDDTTVRQPRLIQVAAIVMALGLGPLIYMSTFDSASASTKRRSKTKASTTTSTTTSTVPPVPGKVVVTTPTSGSKLRADLLRLVRPKLEARDVLGKPLDLVVITMRVSGRYAWVVVHPQRPGGRTVVVDGSCQTNPKTFTAEFWMVRKGSLWTIAFDRKPCDATSIENKGEGLGAPPELVGRTSWS